MSDISINEWYGKKTVKVSFVLFSGFYGDSSD